MHYKSLLVQARSPDTDTHEIVALRMSLLSSLMCTTCNGVHTTIGSVFFTVTWLSHTLIISFKMMTAAPRPYWKKSYILVTFKSKKLYTHILKVTLDLCFLELKTDICTNSRTPCLCLCFFHLVRCPIFTDFTVLVSSSLVHDACFMNHPFLFFQKALITRAGQLIKFLLKSHY